MIDQLVFLFKNFGDDKYDENISQSEHAIQCALIARQHNASEELVVAALLHDVGHLIQLQRNHGKLNLIDNDLHESLGASFLISTFGPNVTQPIALHVQAKRYLCSVIPSYESGLSKGSKNSLTRQGGLMDADEVSRFSLHQYFEDSINIRKWDDLAKTENVNSGQFADFVPLLKRVTVR